MKLKKGDNVVILSGKDKGKTGTIDRVNPQDLTVVVPGINMYKRHTKKKDEKTPGGIIDSVRPIHISKVAFLDKQTKKASRIGYLVTKGEKVRISKKSNAQI